MTDLNIVSKSFSLFLYDIDIDKYRQITRLHNTVVFSSILSHIKYLKSEFGKMQTRITPNTDTFQTVVRLNAGLGINYFLRLQNILKYQHF